MKQPPEKPTTETAWDWYDWAMKTAVAVRANKGEMLWHPQTNWPTTILGLPKACQTGITEGWKAGVHAVEVMNRLSGWRERTS